MKPRIALDIDGVLADYTGLFARFAGITPRTRPTRFSMIEPGWVSSREEFLAAHEQVLAHLTEMGLRDRLAPEAVCVLIQHGFTIEYITNRAGMGEVTDEQVFLDTSTWLSEHGFPYYDNLTMTATKHHEDTFDVILEDAPDNIKAIAATGRQVVVYSDAYNQGFFGTNIEYVTSIREFVTNTVEGRYDL